MIYIISTILLGLIFSTKAYFLLVSRGGNPLFLEYISTISIFTVIVAGSFFYIKGLARSKISFKKRSKKLSLLFIFISFIFVIVSFYITINKKAVLWDSAALYDARAKFMLQGVSISDMVKLSEFDPNNTYYYVLYPPYTSLIHLFWYKLAIPFPVGVFYSFQLLLLLLVIFIFTKKFIGILYSSILALIVVSNGVIFSSSISEYTNLPFTLQMLLGVMLLYEFLEDKTSWKSIYGVGLVITSMWIRFLEPLWFGVVISMFVVIFSKEKFSLKLLLPFLFLAYGVVEYFSWNFFVSSFGDATKVVSFATLKILEPLIGIFTGSLFSMSVFFVKSWGLILITYLGSIYLSFLNHKKNNFFGLFLITTIAIYFFGLYFVSFQSEWWDKLGDSLIRGSTFMIPLSGFLILKYLHDQNN